MYVVSAERLDGFLVTKISLFDLVFIFMLIVSSILHLRSVLSKSPPKVYKRTTTT
jgi:hypothetical protein